jgi:ribosomal protein S18 acetylase RimI-like enzyme
VDVRTFRPGEDDIALVDAYREAFANHYGYLEQPFDVDLERWRYWMKGDDFEADLWFLAMAGERVCGFCTAYATSRGGAETGLIDELGVRPAWRRRGVGRALLIEAFRALRNRGVPAVELEVDTENRSGALGVYEDAGMRSVRASYTFLKELRAGRDLLANG